MEWHYAEGGKPVGPVSDQDLANLVAQGKINAQTMVWHPGMTTWAAYGTIAAAASRPATQQAVAPDRPTHARCSECGTDFPLTNMIQHGTDYVCAQCKPAYFQRLQEGALSSQGNTPNKELMEQGLASLRDAWGPAVGVGVVYWIIRIGVSAIPFYVGTLIWMFLGGPFNLGLATFFLAVIRGEPRSFGMLFEGFNRFWKAALANLMVELVKLALSLLYIVPLFAFGFAGAAASSAHMENNPFLPFALLSISLPLAIPLIVAACAFVMTFRILSDNPSMGSYDAIVRSVQMMRGKKWKFFCLMMRFSGWAILATIPCGLGFIFLMPYIWATVGKFYDDVKGRVVSPA